MLHRGSLHAVGASLVPRADRLHGSIEEQLALSSRSERATHYWATDPLLQDWTQHHAGRCLARARLDSPELCPATA